LLKKNTSDKEPLNLFTTLDKILIIIASLGGLLYIFNDPISKISSINLLPFSVRGLNGNYVAVLIGLAALLLVIIMRSYRFTKIIRDRLIAVPIFAVFTVFFFAAFEQALGSMTIFARDYTQRSLIGSSAMVFKIIDLILTVGPLLIITWVLYLLFKKTSSKIFASNVVLSIAFVLLWGIVFWKIDRTFSEETTEVGASWFGILNSFFIITLAPFFSRWWESKYNPSAAVKYALGLILLGLALVF